MSVINDIAKEHISCEMTKHLGENVGLMSFPHAIFLMVQNVFFNAPLCIGPCIRMFWPMHPYVLAHAPVCFGKRSRKRKTSWNFVQKLNFVQKQKTKTK